MPESRLQRFKLQVEYDGTNFVGWQLQPDARSVQGTLEEAVQHLFSQQVRVHGAGRTDAGVHASGQVAHLDMETHLDAATLRRALNAELPPDITIRQAEEAAPDFHARFSASSRSYVYTIAHERVSIARHTQWIVYSAVEHDPIRASVAMLNGTHDFTAFSKYTPDQPHHFCHVFEVGWEEGAEVSRFRIRANRFLQGMVRCIVGGLILVGRGRLTPVQFGDILDSRDRSRAPMLAPPHGLVLTGVRYIYEEREVIRDIMRELLDSPRGD